MKASFLSDLEKAKQAQKIVKGAMDAAASKIFLFYLNLLSPESKYAWNKIIREQTESNLYKVTPWKAQGECCISRFTSA